MPKLTEGNAKAILELSDFLMMPNLKSSCVSYIEKVPITIKNCIKMLELSNMYSFKLTLCYKFVRVHLKEILERDEAKYMAKDLVIALLTNPFLSYITAEEKFMFAAKWADGSEQNKAEFPDVFKALDLDSTSRYFFETVVLQTPLVVEMISNSQHVPPTRNTQHMHRVICFPGYMMDNRMACLDLDDERWCGVETWLPKARLFKKAFKRNYIEGVQDSPIIFRKPTEWCCKISVQNLQTGSRNISTIRTSERRQLSVNCFSCSIYGETFVAFKNARRKIKRQPVQTDDNQEGLQRPLNDGNTNSRSAFAQYGDSPRLHTARIETVTVFSGPLQHPTTKVNPIYTIRGTFAESMCINGNSMIALLAEDRARLYIYDTSSCLLDTISFSEHLTSLPRSSRFDIRLEAKEGGFVMYVYGMAWSISRLHGPMLIERYSVKAIEIVHNGSRSPTYFYSNSTWVRFLNGNRKDKNELACMSHDDLTNGEAQDLVWKRLPYPKELSGVCGVSQTYKMFMIKLPVSKLNCPFSCRHCAQQKEDLGMPPSNVVLILTNEEMYGVSPDEDDSSEDNCYYPYFF